MPCPGKGDKINYLGVFFYNIFLLFFRVGIHIASPFHAKAGKWVAGRRRVFQKLEAAIKGNGPVIWFHCASLGEFEQGRPVMERLRREAPGHRILLTFFSPSGYEVRKDYKGADWVFYLPLDGPRNARRFLEIVKPSLVVFVKYEFWYYYLKKIKYRNIPLLLVSAIFRKDMSFFKWYGAIQRKILSRFDHLFVQNQESLQLLEGIGLGGICSVSGDTRFDRVVEIAEGFSALPLIKPFVGHAPCMVAGSTWPDDEAVIRRAVNEPGLDAVKWILAPHEIGESHLRTLRALFPEAILYSQIAEGQSPLPASRVLIMDNMGMLSRLYRYASLTYVGGGFQQTGVHNVLEAAVYGKVVLFGPHYEKYSEAVGLVLSGGGISFREEAKDASILGQLIEGLLHDPAEREFRETAAGHFVQMNRGATERITRFIQENRLLTR